VFFYRTAAGREVDIVLEDRRRRIVGIEVKAAATLTGGDFKGLEDLAHSVGKRFHRGVVLHAGDEAVRAGPVLYAVPIGALWRSGPGRHPRPRHRARVRGAQSHLGARSSSGLCGRNGVD